MDGAAEGENTAEILLGNTDILSNPLQSTWVEFFAFLQEQTL
jgi:hypothetical protein